MKHFSRQKTSLRRYILFTAIGLLAAAGIALIGNGLWIKAKAQLAQVLLNQAFERVLSAPPGEQTNARPWRWADIKPMARLQAPRLDKTAIILNNTSGEALAFGPGHLPDTPLPGQQGTAVLSAHRDTHFSWIKDLRQGDNIEIENADGSKVTFSVRRSWVANFDASGIDADSDETLLAFSTCYPFDSKTPGPLRYIVEAEIVDHSVDASLLSMKH